jgi:multidrug resistance efflux pump
MYGPKGSASFERDCSRKARTLAPAKFFIKSISTYQAAVAEARAQLANAQAAVGAAQKRAERYRQLPQIGGVSQQGPKPK